MTDEKWPFAHYDHYSTLLGDRFELNSLQDTSQPSRDFVGAKFYHNHTTFLSNLLERRISTSSNSAQIPSPI